MKKFILILGILLALFTAWYYLRNPLGAKVKIRSHVFRIELAVTPKEKERGLGERDNLPPDHGMLFVYDHKDQYPFWMKGMRFALDFVWIDGTTVVDLTENVPSTTTEPLPIYRPAVPVDKILELNARDIQTYGITIGDTVEFLE